MCVIEGVRLVGLYSLSCNDCMSIYLSLMCVIEGVCLVGSYSLSCRLPANSGHRHGYHAGKNYHNQERIHHISTGMVCEIDKNVCEGGIEITGSYIGFFRTCQV
jgi:hypothetical protein